MPPTSHVAPLCWVWSIRWQTQTQRYLRWRVTWKWGCWPYPGCMSGPQSACQRCVCCWSRCLGSADRYRATYNEHYVPISRTFHPIWADPHYLSTTGTSEDGARLQINQITFVNLWLQETFKVHYEMNISFISGKLLESYLNFYRINNRLEQKMSQNIQHWAPVLLHIIPQWQMQPVWFFLAKFDQKLKLWERNQWQ